MADDDDYIIPLTDQRNFGAGLKRKRVQFTTADKESQPQSERLPSPTAGDRYLSMVLKNRESNQRTTESKHSISGTHSLDQAESARKVESVCSICNLPFDPSEARAHETSLAHQICMSHSHPPSHLDRTRQGFKILASYDWDLDSRQGLGANGQGLRDPIKMRQKNNMAGLGMRIPTSESKKVDLHRVVQKLDAKQTRQQAEKLRKDREKLQDLFYGNEDIAKHL
ncbi:MAG: hypothetical protein Q9190_000722 [Brigantiaea leucoxantha]